MREKLGFMPGIIQRLFCIWDVEGGTGVAGKVFAAALPFGTGDVHALVRFGAGQPVGQPGGA